jgi:transposase
MLHIAIDLGSAKSQVCVRKPDGEIIEEGAHPTTGLNGQLKRYAPSRVVLETCAEAFSVADAALAAGHEVRIVPATMVRTLGVGSRGVKTDKRDARILSEVSCRIELPSVHIPSPISRNLKSLLALRDSMVASRTKLINCVRGYLRTRLMRVRLGATKSFPVKVRRALEASPDGAPVALERVLAAIETLTNQIAEATKELDDLAAADETCKRLMTAPGVSTISALRFLSAIDDVSRFPTASAVQSYLGLTPGENSSSQRQRRTGITKAGASQVRWTLGQACWNAWRHRPNDPLVVWAQKVAERRGRAIAIVAMTRRLAGILFAIWRDGAKYDASKLRIDASGMAAAAKVAATKQCPEVATA